MDEERRRREEAERERDELRRELYALREPRESPQSVDEEPERAETPLRYGKLSGAVLVEESVRRIGGACRTIRFHRTPRGS